MGKLSDLRERRIFQILVAYAATGWIALEVVDQLVDRQILPEVAYTLTLTWYVGGFFASAVVGWYHGEKGSQKVLPMELGLLGIVALAVVGASVSHVEAYRARLQAAAAAGESSMELRRIAVRYFDDLSGDGAYGHLAEGLTEDLIDRLSRIRTLHVVSGNGVAPFRGSNDVGADSVARAVQAGTVVHGSLDVAGERLRISFRLLDGESGAEIRRASLEGAFPELLMLQEELARQVAVSLEEWLGEAVELRRREDESGDVRAWASVQRAKRAIGDMERAAAAGRHDEAVAAYAGADELLGAAETLDPQWTEPTTLRAWAAYWRSEVADAPAEVVRWLEVGEAHAGRALSRSPNSAQALDARGSLRYRGWLREVAPSATEHEALLRGARSDLERAVDIDPSLAAAHELLSQLYARALQDISRASVAARTAYEEDAYLESADDVVWHLFRYSWHLRQLSQAQRWCREGARRFAGDHRFLRCELDLMTTPAVEPDVENAWSLVERVDSVAGGPATHEALAARIVVAGVVARAGMPDSARAVLDRTRALAGAEQDARPELLALEAEIRSRVLGDQDEALALLERYRAAAPDRPFDSGNDWWWSDLRSHPGYQALISGR